MTTKGGWFDKFVVKELPNKSWFQFLSAKVVVPYWDRRTPTPPLEGGPRPSVRPGDSLQRMMNLVMPLKDTSAIGRAKAASAIAQNVDEIFAGLDNVGTVHFARFVLIGDYLCMISVYDGDFSNYIRDFIATIGSVFDAVIELVDTKGKVITPSETHIEAFIDWVHDHDLFQVPDFPTDLFALQEKARGGPRKEGPDGLRSLSYDLILQMRANPNCSLGGGYCNYPGFSAAQVRHKLGVGW